TPPPLAASITSPAAGATVAGTVTLGLAASGGTAPYTYRLTVGRTPVLTPTSSSATPSVRWSTPNAGQRNPQPRPPRPRPQHPPPPRALAPRGPDPAPAPPARGAPHPPRRKRHGLQHGDRRSRRQRRHRAVHVSAQRRWQPGVLDDHERHHCVV